MTVVPLHGREERDHVYMRSLTELSAAVIES